MAKRFGNSPSRKTIFILDYISNESLRRRIQRGLNKGEAVNTLARAIFFGKVGSFGSVNCKTNYKGLVL
ncbi:MAG: Tn3 family transposase [Dehalobacterium sp.]